MKYSDLTHVRAPEDRTRFVLNLAVSLWLVEEKKRIEATGNAKRIARYKTIDAFDMAIEPPIIFKDNKFMACMADRKAGTLLVDRVIPCITFDDFIKYSKPSDKVGIPVQQSTADAIETVTLAKLYELLQNQDQLSKTPVYQVVKIDGEDGYAIVLNYAEGDVDFDLMVSWVFRDYTFESIKLELLEPGDSGYPSAPNADTASSFYGGKVTLKDTVLVEREVPFNFINLKQLSDIVKDQTPSEPERKDPVLTDKDGVVINNGDAIKDNQPVFSGDGLKPGSTVIITDNGEKIGEAVVDEDGKWTFKPDAPFENGEHHFNISGETPEGKPVTGDITVNVDADASGGGDGDGGNDGGDGGNDGGDGGNGDDGGETDPNESDEDKALKDPTEDGKYAAPGTAGFGLTVESSKDITGVTRTLSNIPKVTIPFPYVDKGSID